MPKNFAPRVSKKERTKVALPENFDKNLFRIHDEQLLKGAQLADVKLADIVVRQQVRTKFNDESLQELAENIRANGLIQPLVLHREGNKFVLLCGERRFRAMSLIGMEKAPAFILEGKSAEELMAIQFSENSAREELHYIDKADGIYNYHVATGASERKIEQDLGICKTEVHRAIQLAKLPTALKEAAKVHNIEKYVLLEFYSVEEKNSLRANLLSAIVSGQVTKRSQFKKFIQACAPTVEKVRAKKKEITKKTPKLKAPKVEKKLTKSPKPRKKLGVITDKSVII